MVSTEYCHIMVRSGNTFSRICVVCIIAMLSISKALT